MVVFADHLGMGLTKNHTTRVSVNLLKEWKAVVKALGAPGVTVKRDGKAFWAAMLMWMRSDDDAKLEWINQALTYESDRARSGAPGRRLAGEEAVDEAHRARHSKTRRRIGVTA